MGHDSRMPTKPVQNSFFSSLFLQRFPGGCHSGTTASGGRRPAAPWRRLGPEVRQVCQLGHQGPQCDRQAGCCGKQAAWQLVKASHPGTSSFFFHHRLSPPLRCYIVLSHMAEPHKSCHRQVKCHHFALLTKDVVTPECVELAPGPLLQDRVGITG